MKSIVNLLVAGAIALCASQANAQASYTIDATDANNVVATIDMTNGYWNNASDIPAEVLAANTLVFVGEVQSLNCWQNAGSKATTVSFKDAKSGQWCPISFQYWSETLTNAVISKYDSKLAFYAFKDVKNMETVEIPANIKVIESMAFDNCQIKNIVIPATVEYVYTQAFNNSIALTDVYAKSRNTVCEHDGFDYRITDGQTVEYAQRCTLHFPADDIDYFAGNYKVLAEEQRQLIEHRNAAQNGWQEFINTGYDFTPNLQNTKLIRTFSSNDYAFETTGDLHAYLVTDYDEMGIGATLLEIKYIPKNTGVVLYCPNGDEQLLKVALDNNLPYNQYDDNYDVKNYLDPTSNYDEDGVKNNVYVANIDKQDGVVTFRNFLLGNYTSTNTYKSLPSNERGENYIGFFRAIGKTQSAGKAFLHLPASMFSDSQGGEALVLNYYNEEDVEYMGCPWIPYKNDDARNSRVRVHTASEPVVEETTAINAFENEANAFAAVYSVNGQFIGNTTKGLEAGVYVVNGKKTFVK